MVEEAPTGVETLNAMARMAEQVQDLPLQVICAGLAHWVAGLYDRLTEEEAVQILELGGVLWRRASSN